MKLPHTVSRYASVCLCLLFSYALLISTVAPLGVRNVFASSVEKRKADNSGESIQRHPLNTRAQAGPTPVSFVQSGGPPQSRDGEVLVRFRATASEQDKDIIALTHNGHRTKLRGGSGLESFA